jgi:hypothetical protein
MHHNQVLSSSRLQERAAPLDIAESGLYLDEVSLSSKTKDKDKNKESVSLYMRQILEYRRGSRQVVRSSST